MIYALLLAIGWLFIGGVMLLALGWAFLCWCDYCDREHLRHMGDKNDL